MKCLCDTTSIWLLKGRDGVGGVSMSENAYLFRPMFNQLIKLKICCNMKYLMQYKQKWSDLLKIPNIISAYSGAASNLKKW